MTAAGEQRRAGRRAPRSNQQSAQQLPPPEQFGLTVRDAHARLLGTYPKIPLHADLPANAAFLFRIVPNPPGLLVLERFSCPLRFVSAAGARRVLGQRVG